MKPIFTNLSSNWVMRNLLCSLLVIAFCGSTYASESDQTHDAEIALSAEKMALAKIQIEAIFPQVRSRLIYAPGEIKANGYTSAVLAPRLDSVVVSRHATLGEPVKAGQKLVTLYSPMMAEFQANYVLAKSEWLRLQQLGNKTISQSRLLAAETKFQAAKGQLRAFGMTESAIQALSINKASQFGKYHLTAQIAGMILQDDFIQGQSIKAGEPMMRLADEKQLWVEASVPANRKLDLALNSSAIVQLEGNEYPAKVIQSAHTINTKTRTRIIRLAVDNPDDQLHSGMFVKIFFKLSSQQKVMAVPETALMRSADGDWTVFVEEHAGEFKAVEVKLGESFADFRQVIGLDIGTRVVTQGAFFVASEIAKTGFDPHNH